MSDEVSPEIAVGLSTDYQEQADNWLRGRNDIVGDSMHISAYKIRYAVREAFRAAAEPRDATIARLKQLLDKT